MKARRRVLVALMVSILLHATVVTAPGWVLPSLDDLLHPKQAQSLEAWLRAPGKPSVAGSAKPRPAKPRAAKPASPAPSPNALVVPNMPIPEPVAPEAPPVPEPEAPPTATAGAAPATDTGQAASNTQLLAMHVRIKYSVTMGERGFIIGETVEELDNDGNTYRLRTSTGTTGLARLFKPVDMTYTSIGDIVDGRLQPRLFTVERDGKPAENALFDWPGSAVLVGERRFPLAPGTQDMLSVFCELALIPIFGPSVTVPVVTGKKIEPYQFAVIGEESLPTPMGEQPTLHLRTVGTEPQVTDVWLGLNVARLPVRIRHVDRSGDLYDQVAARIEVVPTMEGNH